jgi:8-oxo-dGTP diphosphatase
MQQVVKSDWQLYQLPEERALLKVSRVFDRSQMERIRKGHKPTDMDDRWFVYFENNNLYLHRSWTGYCVYVISFSEIDKGAWQITQCLVSRDAEQYGETNDEASINLLHLVLNDLLDR